VVTYLVYLVNWHRNSEGQGEKGGPLLCGNVFSVFSKLAP
jgi:hypothetical protein